MLKTRSKQNSIHACNFIHNYREKRSVCLEHLIKNDFVTYMQECAVEPPTKTKVEVNDQGSLLSFSIGMHDM